MENRPDEDHKDVDVDEHKPKKRRLHGACDGCRKKKIKCDSAETQPKKCTNCRASKLECTHDMPRQPKKSETQAAYIVSQDETIEKMRRLLLSVYPEKDLQLLLDKPIEDLPSPPHPGSPIPKGVSPSSPASASASGSTPKSTHKSLPTPSTMSDVTLPKVSSLSQEISQLSASASASGSGLASPPPTHANSITASASGSAKSIPNATAEEDEEESSDEEEDFAHLDLAEHLKELSIDALEDRFFGRSSGFMFFKEAWTLRGKLAGMNSEPDSSKFRRPMYWDVRPWELDYTALPSHPVYEYPEDDLLRSLVFIYFEKFNSLFPLLHKPTFTRMLAEQRHLRDPDFGMVVLMVCALAARYSHDPRVLVSAPESTGAYGYAMGGGGGLGQGQGGGLSAGWKYFRQVPMHRKSLLYKAGLFDLQYYVLATMYMVGTSIPQNSWYIVGILVRYLLEMGGHRRKPHSQKPSADEELMKRVFWCVLYLDRMISSFLGRPCLIQDEDYDIDFPIECDDEYWDPPSGNPDDAFKQPPGKPSYITAFVCCLKLAQILGLTLRTLYATKKAKALSGMVGAEWEQRIVAELDSSLNQWKDSVPGFLQWDAEREDSTFFHQSVSMYAMLYYVQIQVHRPFLMKRTALSMSSLAMCTNAARSCARLLEVALTRGMRVAPMITIAAFCSGTVIALNLWGIRHTGLLGDASKETINLQKCINVLKECEKRWHVAGRACDMLKEIAAFEEYSGTAALPKRRRDDTSITPPVQNNQAPVFGTGYPYPRPAASPMAYPLSNPMVQNANAALGAAGSARPPVSMAHSMAITPVSSMSGSTSMSPPVPTSGSPMAASTPSMPIISPGQNLMGQDWDLGNLLMMQMYNNSSQFGPSVQFSMGQGFLGQQAPYQAANTGAGTGMNNLGSLPIQPQQQAAAGTPLSPGLSGAVPENATGSPESFGTTEDLLSLFSDVPMAFSLEEWEAYLAGLNSS